VTHLFQKGKRYDPRAQKDRHYYEVRLGLQMMNAHTHTNACVHTRDVLTCRPHLSLYFTNRVRSAQKS
jgi:hypothetical protein